MKAKDVKGRNVKGNIVKTMIAMAPLALLAACGGGGASEEDAKVDPVATVRTAPATLGTTADTLTVYGIAEAGPGGERSMTVQAESVMDRILAPTGTTVRAGQVVALLRAGPTSSADAAKAASDAASADAAYARARRLRGDGLVSDADVETARAAAATADAARAASGRRAASLVVRAPASGTVQNLIAKPGDAIAAGTVVATIGATGNLRARFGIDPAAAVRVHAGQPIGLASIRATTMLSSTVIGVDPQVDPSTRLAAVFAGVPAGNGIAVGEPLRGIIQVASSSDGLTIPYAALLDDGGRSYVFVVQGGVAHRRDVLPGSTQGDRIAILKGVGAGDKVVTEGGTALTDGMKVSEGGAKPRDREAEGK